MDKPIKLRLNRLFFILWIGMVFMHCRSSAPGESNVRFVDGSIYSDQKEGRYGSVIESSGLDTVTVLLLGDSITEGKVSGDAGMPYAQVVADILGPSFNVINAGCSGATSLDWGSDSPEMCGSILQEPNLFERLAAPHLPADLVTIMLGTNDSKAFFQSSVVDFKNYAQALSQLINKIRERGVKRIILMTPPPCCVEHTAGKDRIEEYVDIVKAICAIERLVECGPDLHALLDPNIHFDKCDVHPNSQGHELIGNTLAEAIVALMR